MKILVVGSTGMLGSTLKDYFFRMKISYDKIDRDVIDLSKCSFYDLSNAIIKINPDVLINCAGIIKQRKNISISDFISVNGLLPHRLSEICENNFIRMIHITTDCVFSGKIGGYNENSAHDYSDEYGMSKSIGEPKNCMVIRASIIGEENKNKLSLLEWTRSNKNNKINGYKNHLWNGVTCLQLSKIIIKIIEDNNFWMGVRHIFSESISKYDLLKTINEIYGLDIDINPIDDCISINRTLNSIYDITEFKIPKLYHQIEETRDFHKIKNIENANCS